MTPKITASRKRAMMRSIGGASDWPVGDVGPDPDPCSSSGGGGGGGGDGTAIQRSVSGLPDVPGLERVTAG